MKIIFHLCLALAALAVTTAHADKTFIDYFLPTPIVGSLSTNEWGAPGILPRDAKNGLEDASLKSLPADTNNPTEATVKQWYYWDGQIIKSPTGKYYMFASRWDQAKGHGGWGGSSAVYAVSDNLFGPYVDKGLLWTNVIKGVAGRGHNVTALTLPDGRYAVLISETRPGSIYISQSLDGPWEFQGPITFATNEFSGDVRRLGSNMSIMVRPDGGFEIVQRSGLVLISTNGVLGPYVVQGPSVYPTTIDGQRVHNLEDPVVWFSGGLYHIVVNSWSARKAYHLTSTDGIHDWTLRALAYDPTTDFVRYTDGTVNHWNKMERPGVLIENGHVAAVTLAVIDIPKEQNRGNEPHGSKVIVVPFDGAALDRDLQTNTEAAHPTGKPAPRPLYRDPPFDAPTDPVLTFNAETKKWFMYYTQRRATATNAPGVAWVHGTRIGMAESSDGGATWTYMGTANIHYGLDVHPNDYTYWAPEVIWVNGTYHMYLTYVPGIFNDWNHPRQIAHLTSKDGINWDTVGQVDLKSDRVIDPCVMQLPDGNWRMWYKDERRSPTLSYADSTDLFHWEPKGNAVTNFSGEGPKVFHWQDSYWLIADCWRNGMRVWKSDDCLNWKLQAEPLLGSHGDVVVSGGRAWWFYFTESGRRAVINVVELSVVDEKLLHGDPKQPTYIDLKPVREEEK
jgi:hypothetical protein